MNSIKLGKFLAQLRTEKDITQEQLAEMLNIDKRKVSRWETGNSMPEFDMLIKLAEIYNVTLYEISICERLKDETLIEKTKHHLKSIKDLKKINIKKKISIIAAIIIGVFFGLCTIFTINNYNTVEIYSLKSLDDDYRIEGTYVKAKDYNVFNLVHLKHSNNTSNSLISIDVHDVKYTVLNCKNNRIIFVSKAITSEQINLLYLIDYTSFTYENTEYLIDENDILTFQINYKNKDNELNNIEFKFKLIKKFDNN